MKLFLTLFVILILLIVLDRVLIPSCHDLLFRLQDDLNIIQIGGHVGPRWFGGRDPVYRFVFDTRRNTRAIIVEPIKAHFKKLQENYADYSDRVKLENVAICKDDTKSHIKMYVPVNHLLGLEASTTASISSNHIEKHNQNQNSRTEMVRCMTFENLLKKYPDFKCNVLVIDVEGYEYDLIMSIRWLDFRPYIVQFENVHMDPVKQQEVHKQLTQVGYHKMYQGAMDVVYVQSSYLIRWNEQTRYIQRANMTWWNYIIYVILILVATALVYVYFSKVVAIILIIVSALISFIKLMPLNVDQFLHTKVIHFPQWFKCGLDINCGKQCSLKNANNWESQTNADIDLYSIGHIVMWAIIAFLEPKVTLQVVGAFSVIWEGFEVLMGCLGFPMHGRVTDVLVNLYGYFLGSSLRS